ncbi:MAG: hypothetical protein IKX42_12075 [Fibrobacter sp.]|jgi:hypothetical protein|nr:hypothetical protein [Fibrobacter sp.]
MQQKALKRKSYEKPQLKIQPLKARSQLLQSSGETWQETLEVFKLP